MAKIFTPLCLAVGFATAGTIVAPIPAVAQDCAPGSSAFPSCLRGKAAAVRAAAERKVMEQKMQAMQAQKMRAMQAMQAQKMQAMEAQKRQAMEAQKRQAEEAQRQQQQADEAQRRMDESILLIAPTIPLAMVHGLRVLL